MSIQCHRCNQFGHYASNCPLNDTYEPPSLTGSLLTDVTPRVLLGVPVHSTIIPSPPGQASNVVLNARSFMEDIQCYSCHQLGHFGRDCPILNTSISTNGLLRAQKRNERTLRTVAVIGNTTEPIAAPRVARVCSQPVQNGSRRDRVRLRQASTLCQNCNQFGHFTRRCIYLFGGLGVPEAPVNAPVIAHTMAIPVAPIEVPVEAPVNAPVIAHTMAPEPPLVLALPEPLQPGPRTSMVQWSTKSLYYNGIRGKYTYAKRKPKFKNTSGLWIYSFRVVSWDPTDSNVPGTWSKFFHAHSKVIKNKLGVRNTLYYDKELNVCPGSLRKGPHYD